MPNWCYNTVEIVGPKENIDQFEKFLTDRSGEDWFDYFLPTPVELNDTQSPNRDTVLAQQLIEKYGAIDWYDWNVNNWGTKWNCTANGFERTGEMSIKFTCETAWAPPTTLYQRIADQEFGEYDVKALYLEEGMAFVGRFEDGFDDCYNYSDLESLDGIPDEIVEHWNLREQLEDQEDWDAEEALNDIIDEFKDEPVKNEPKGSQVNTPEGRAWLRGLLHNEEVKITFTKKDGTEREMLCTLVSDKIPSEQTPKNTGKAQSDESIAVFDLENEGWRSFRWDSVTKIEFTLG